MALQSAIGVVSELRQIVGDDFVRLDETSLQTYGVDALGKGHPPDVVVIPANTEQIASIARLCNAERVPLVVRGAGTGFTGGAAPTRGGGVGAAGRRSRPGRPLRAR